MAGNLTQTEISELKDAFAILDPKGIGFLGTSEIRNILASLGKCGSDEEVMRIINHADTDEDGKLSFPEFLNMMASKFSNSGNSGMESASAIEHMFKIFDRDNSGFITYTEMKRTLDEMPGEKASNHELDTMMKDADSDGDGKLSFIEFAAIIRRTYPGQYPE